MFLGCASVEETKNISATRGEIITLKDNKNISGVNVTFQAVKVTVKVSSTTAPTIFTCDYPRDQYNCSCNVEETKDLNIDQCHMNVSRTNQHIVAIMKIRYEALKSPSYPFCFTYEIKPQGGAFSFTSTKFNIAYEGETHNNTLLLFLCKLEYGLPDLE